MRPKLRSVNPPRVQSARLNWINCLLESDLPCGAKCVGLVIASHTSTMGDHAWPGIDRIARLASLTPRPTTLHIQTLEAREFLIVTRRNGGLERQTNLYELSIPGWKNVNESTNPLKSNPREKGGLNTTSNTTPVRVLQSGQGPRLRLCGLPKWSRTNEQSKGSRSDNS